jgi:hypothetical protein
MRLVLFLGAVSVLLATLALAGEPQEATDPEDALLQAIESYRGDRLEDALAWIDRAAALIAAERDGVGVAPQSNAASLLEYLDYYHDYAYGKDAELDDEYENLLSLLEKVHDVDKRGGTISSLGDDAVHYGADGLVSWIGDVAVHYEGTSNRISHVGDYDVHYSGTSSRPSWIGSIQFFYGVDDHVSWVAGESVR